MKRYLCAVWFSVTLLLAACGSPKPVQQSLKVTVVPEPLRVGNAQVVALVRDAHGHAVTNARVTVITSRPAVKMQRPMPMKGMGRTGETVIASSVGNGMYRANIQITEATLWSIVVHAESPEGFSTEQISERAKPY